ALGPSSELFSDLSRKELVADQIAELSTRYRNAAFKCLEADNYLWQQNVTTLQALILIYSINHSHGQTWTLLGMTYHIALSLGCHIDPSDFGLDIVRCEERRRCWAGLMMLFMIQGTSMGHLGPDPWATSEGVQMPSDLDDCDLVANEYVLPLTSRHATQMSYLLFETPFYKIANEVCPVVRNAIKPPTSLIGRLDEKILSEQRSWHDKYLVHSAIVEPPTYHKAHLNILQGYSHQLLMLLHNHAMRTSIDSQQCHLSASKALRSAKKLLRIHSVFFTKIEFSPFRWYLRGIGSFHAYHAAVSLMAILTERSWDLAHRDILSSVKQCVDRFGTLAETSIIYSKAVPVL
ncbi:uncharacterized protein SETTUDRAFT_81226, partial [Exserohilum turcica Et28A]